MAELTERFDQALEFASDLHRSQKRKGSGVPYVAHLLAVCALVLEDGGDEDEAIAALLHDSVEDQGGADTLVVIRTLFGDRVAEIVAGCTDDRGKGYTPLERKRKHIEHLRQCVNPSILRVVAADKLHNARSLLRDFQIIGVSVFDRFNLSQEETLQYYYDMSNLLLQQFDSPLSVELARVWGDLSNLATLHRIRMIQNKDVQS